MAKLISIAQGPVNHSERRVVQTLVDTLPDEYRVIPNLTLGLATRGQRYEYDVIVIAPHAVYVVEVKGWRGSLQALNRRDWRLPGGKIVSNPLPLNDQKARVLASLLKEHTFTHREERLRTPFVQSCLVLGDDDVELDLFDDEQRRVFTPSTLPWYLKMPGQLDARHAPHGNPYRPVLHDICEAIVGRLNACDPTSRRFGQYAVTSVEEMGDQHAVFLARHASFDDGRCYRVRTWFLSSYLNDDATYQRKIKVLRRGAEALHTIGDHPNIVTLRGFGSVEDEFFEITDWSDTGTLSTAMSTGLVQRLSLTRKLTIFRDITTALAVAGDKGVYHRNLCPDAILFTPDGQLRLANFDHAFLEQNSVTVFADMFSAAHNPYRPPELDHATNNDIFDNSDLFSLGKIVFDVFTGDTPKRVLINPDDPSAGRRYTRLSERCELPTSIRDDLDALVASLLAHDPNDRPANPRAFLDALEPIIARLTPSSDAAATPAPPQPNHSPDPAALRRQLGVFEPDEHIDDANVVQRHLGGGAHAQVYEVFSEVLRDHFALKLFTRVPDGDTPHLRVFQLLRGVAHRHVVKAFWAGSHREGQRELPYLLLEKIDGEPLSQRLTSPYDRDDALDWIAQLLDALQAIHPTQAAPDDGILHRDIKPENILIASHGAVLTDFSAAVRADLADTLPTGALRYTPPDLASGGWDARGDLFAMGCLLYELLAKQPPWEDTAPGREPAPPVSRHAPDLPDALVALTARAIAPKRADRFPSAKAFLDALNAARRDDPSPSPPTTPVAPPTRADLWDAALTSAVIRRPFVEVALFEQLASIMRSDTQDEAAFVSAGARALSLERPLLSALPSLYDTLITHTNPAPAFIDPSAEPDPDAPRPPLNVPPDHWLVVFDDLHPFEWSSLLPAHSHWVWTAGPTNPSNPDEGLAALSDALRGVRTLHTVDDDDALHRALADDRRQLRVPTPRARRVDEPLTTLLARRRQRIDRVVHAIRDASHTPVWITSLSGCVYLGHGLRVDVGDGLPAGAADRTRAAWAARFGVDRWATGTDPMSAATPRATRHARDRTFTLGPLAWPDLPDAPWLARGGLSLCERLLPIFCLSPLNTKDSP